MKNTKKFLELVSKKDSGWLEKPKWRQDNEDWLDISFSIAIKIASTLSANKKTGVYPKSQVELAEAMDCSPQYINKMLRGQERLQIDTICKVAKILKITLIEVPKAELKQTLQYSNANIFGEILNDITASFGTTTMPYSKENIVEVAGENNYALAA